MILTINISDHIILTVEPLLTKDSKYKIYKLRNNFLYCINIVLTNDSAYNLHTKTLDCLFPVSHSV